MRLFLAILKLILIIGMAGFIAGYLGLKSLQKSEDPGRLINKWGLTFVCLCFVVAAVKMLGFDGPGAMFVPAVAVLAGVLLGVLWAPGIAHLLAGSVTSNFDGGGAEIEARPALSIAQAMRNHGNYQKAIQEIESQLERFPEDFQCLMMIAEIHGDHLKDANTAIATVDRILRSPKRAPKNIAYALGKASDWHLKLRGDSDSAREALEKIQRLLPNTEQALVAAQRLAHLGSASISNPEDEPRRITVKIHEEKLGLLGRTAQPPPPEDPEAKASQLVAHLAEHPLDNDAREQLSLIYVDHYKRLDLAMDQLEQLISVPHQPARLVAHWLNLMADYQLKMTGDIEQAKAVLQRIVALFPESSHSVQAQTRMFRLVQELKPQQKSQTFQLGSYEENIGLKSDGRRPRS